MTARIIRGETHVYDRIIDDKNVGKCACFSQTVENHFIIFSFITSCNMLQSVN